MPPPPPSPPGGEEVNENLRALILDRNHESSWHVGHADGGVSAVDVLPAGTTGAECIDTDVFIFDIDVNLSAPPPRPPVPHRQPYAV